MKILDASVIHKSLRHARQGGHASFGRVGILECVSYLTSTFDVAFDADHPSSQRSDRVHLILEADIGYHNIVTLSFEIPSLEVIRPEILRNHVAKHICPNDLHHLSWREVVSWVNLLLVIPKHLHRVELEESNNRLFDGIGECMFMKTIMGDQKVGDRVLADSFLSCDSDQDHLDKKKTYHNIQDMTYIRVELRGCPLYFMIPTEMVSLEDRGDHNIFVPGAFTYTVLGWMRCDEMILTEQGKPLKLVCSCPN